jgi:raffinose/stachyose/melibiose transport system permease protein
MTTWSYPHRRIGRRERRRNAKASLRWLIYLCPAVAATGLFIVYPAVESIHLAFESWAGYGPAHGVGGANFSELWHDTVARQAVLHSLILGGCITIGTVIAGTTIAVAIDRKVVLHRFFKFFIFLPVLLPTTFIGLAWANGYDPLAGWATPLLRDVHLSGVNLADPHTVLFAVAIAAILAGTGFPMIVILAALGDIPRDVHEAATLDGASELQRAWRISLPLVREVIVTVSLLQLIFGLSQFDFVYVMTDGGPGTSSEVISTYVYHQAFDDHRFGYAAAASIAMSLIIILIAMVYMTVFRARGMTRAA